MPLVGFKTFTQTGNVCCKINSELSLSSRKQRKTRGMLSTCPGVYEVGSERSQRLKLQATMPSVLQTHFPYFPLVSYQ